MVFSEDRSIERPALKIFHNLGYGSINLFHEKVGSENILGRETRSDVVLVNVLRNKLQELTIAAREVDFPGRANAYPKDLKEQAQGRQPQEAVVVAQALRPVCVIISVEGVFPLE